jgi:hypothetical protein
MARKSTAPAEPSHGLTFLRSLPPGTTLYTILRHVSASGMSRSIDVRVLQPNAADPSKVDVLCVRVPEVGASFMKSYDKAQKNHGADYKVGGCGMDMGFALVYELGRLAYPDGFTVTPSTIHRNGTPDGETDPDGGYAFAHRWL